MTRRAIDFTELRQDPRLRSGACSDPNVAPAPIEPSLAKEPSTWRPQPAALKSHAFAKDYDKLILFAQPAAARPPTALSLLVFVSFAVDFFDILSLAALVTGAPVMSCSAQGPQLGSDSPRCTDFTIVATMLGRPVGRHLRPLGRQDWSSPDHYDQYRRFRHFSPR